MKRKIIVCLLLVAMLMSHLSSFLIYAMENDDNQGESTSTIENVPNDVEESNNDDETPQESADDNESLETIMESNNDGESDSEGEELGEEENQNNTEESIPQLTRAPILRAPSVTADRQIYAIWNESTSTISMSWNEDDGTNSCPIEDLKNFVGRYSSDVITIDFKLLNENGEQVEIEMPSDCSGFFRYCNKLENIIGEENLNTSNVTTMNGMFVSCSKLKSIDISSWDMSNVTTLNIMFSNCTNLETVDMQGVDISSVTDTYAMFNSCKKLEEVDFSGLNTSNIKDVRQMFANSKINRVKFNGCDLSGVTGNNASGMFAAMEAEEVDLSNAKMPATLNSLFGNSKIQEVKFSNADTTGTTDVNNMLSGSRFGKIKFDGCDFSNVSHLKIFYGSTMDEVDFSNAIMPASLQSIFEDINVRKVIFDKTDTSVVTNTAKMFKNNSKIEEIVISGCDLSNVTDNTQMFTLCNNLVEVDLSETILPNSAQGMFASLSKLEKVDLSGSKMAANSREMFAGCAELKDVNFDNADTSEVTTTQNMFVMCSKLTEVDLSYCDFSELTIATAMFNTSGVKKVYLAAWDVPKLTEASAMFYQCSNLEEVSLDGWNAPNLSVAQAVFYNCTNIKEIDLSSIDSDNLTSIGGIFVGCSNLEKLDISNLNTQNCTDVSGMFSGCDRLNTILLGEEITKQSLQSLSNNWQKTPEGTYYTSLYDSYDSSTIAGKYIKPMYLIWNNSTKTITVGLEPSGDDSARTDEIKSFIQRHKDEVEKIDFTSFDQIVVPEDAGSGLFKDCTKLEEIRDLYNLNLYNVTDVSSMFENCSSLKTIDTMINWGNITNTSSMFKNCTSLENLEAAYINTYYVTDMSSMFENCSNLANIDFYDKTDDGVFTLFFTKNVKNMSNMFKDCGNLRSLQLNFFETDSIQENGMENMLGGLSSIQVLYLGGGVTKLDSNYGLEGDNWIRQSTRDIYSADELADVYTSDMADMYLFNTSDIEDHCYVSISQRINNLFERHDPEHPFTGYCINLGRIGYGTFLYRIDANNDATIEGLLDKDIHTHGYAPLGNSLKEALITIMYYGYPNDAAGIMTKYNLTDEEYVLITQNAVWDFVNRYENKVGPTLYEGNKLEAYNELVSQRFANIPGNEKLKLYLYESIFETQQNMVSLMSVTDDIYGGVLIKKLDNNGEPLAGAEFTITNLETGETRTIVSNASGIASICRTDMEMGLKKGSYKVEETGAPRGYDLTTDYYKFDITEPNEIVILGTLNEGTSMQIMEFKDAEDETIQGGGIEITKKSSSGDSLVGAEFTIYSDAECTNEVAKYTTDADGKIITGKKAFEPGTYYVKETKEPYGYKGNNSVCPVIVSANNYATLELTDEEKTGSVVIRATKILKGNTSENYTFKFELIDDQGNVIQVKENDENDVITFDPIEFTTSMGTYKNYKIREIKEDNSKIIYDEHEELVTVTISDVGEETLECIPIYESDGAIFTNEIKEDDSSDDSEKEDDSNKDGSEDDKENIDNNTDNNDSEQQSNKSKSKTVATGDSIISWLYIMTICSVILIFAVKKIK